MSIEEIPIELKPPEDETPRTHRTERAVAEVGVPELVGDNKAVAQAREARSAVLIDADDILSEWRSDAISMDGPQDPARPPVLSPAALKVRKAQRALNRIRHQTDAAWWVENGSRGARALLEEAMDEIAGETSGSK